MASAFSPGEKDEPARIGETIAKSPYPHEKQDTFHRSHCHIHYTWPTSSIAAYACFEYSSTSQTPELTYRATRPIAPTVEVGVSLNVFSSVAYTGSPVTCSLVAPATVTPSR